MEKTINKMKMKRAISVDQFNKSVAGGLTVGTIDDIINGISQYANVSVNHFIFHFLLLDQSVLKKFSRMIKICMTFC